jgi:hypothetical protein
MQLLVREHVINFATNFFTALQKLGAYDGPLI